MYGWTGKILQVDLTGSRITESSTQPYADKFIGGRGIASRIYCETVPPEITAFDPENRLIFMTGTLVATGAQAATRMSVVGKSPMTLPEGYCYGNIGGFFPAELKKAGFDGIVVTGHAPSPVYLWIHDGEAELRDASSLWGQNAYRTGEMLQRTHGEKTRFITTGVAGENLVRTAVAFASHHSAASAGFGAVMGSKNLKALVVRGTGKLPVADPEALKELNRYTARISHRIASPIPPVLAAAKGSPPLEVIGKGGCYQCSLDCIRRVYRYDHRLEGLRKCQSMEYYLPWKFSRKDEPVETFFDAPTLANDYSIETWELRSMIEWLHACYNADALTEKETGLPLSKIGTRDFLETLLQSIARREGFGDVLAEGLMRAIQQVPDKARAVFSRNIAPIGIHDIFPPRVFTVHALLYSLEPRIYHSILHEIPLTTRAWLSNQDQPGATEVTSSVFRDIARAFWGSDEAADFSTYDGKALATIKVQNRNYIKDSLGLCDFIHPITHSANIPGHVGDPDLEAKVFTAVTGVAGEALELGGERIGNIQRLIMQREGRRVPEDDYPPGYNFTEPIQADPNFGIKVVPGPGEETVSVSGRVIDRDKFTGMLKEYYRLRGWDEETGRPRAETLSALGLDDMITS